VNSINNNHPTLWGLNSQKLCKYTEKKKNKIQLKINSLSMLPRIQNTDSLQIKTLNNTKNKTEAVVIYKNIILPVNKNSS